MRQIVSKTVDIWKVKEGVILRHPLAEHVFQINPPCDARNAESEMAVLFQRVQSYMFCFQLGNYKDDFVMSLELFSQSSTFHIDTNYKIWA